MQCNVELIEEGTKFHVSVLSKTTIISTLCRSPLNTKVFQQLFFILRIIVVFSVFHMF